MTTNVFAMGSTYGHGSSEQVENPREVLALYLIQRRFIDDPEDIAGTEEALIPTFMSHPLLSRIQLVHGTQSASLKDKPMLQRRYSVGPLSDLKD